MGRRRKGLSAEDQALWSKVAATTTPMGVSPAKPKPVPQRPLAAPPEPKSAPPLEPFRIGENASVLRSHQLAPSVSERVNDAPVKMHHGTHKKMVRGKLKPEARIDLHGMTLSRAHPALIGFIQRAHTSGLRLVLVITGKGRDRDEAGPIPIRRGVLRHQVPGWLNAPPLGAVVLDIRTAHLRHGDDGAYYVYLKRR